MLFIPARNNKARVGVGAVVLIFKAEPRTVGVYPLMGRLGGERGVGAIIYMANRRERVLSTILRTFSIIPSCSLSVVGSGRALFSVAAGVLGEVGRIVSRIGPSAILIRKSASAAFMATLTYFCANIPINRIRTNLHACSVCSPCPRRFGHRTMDVVTGCGFTPAGNSGSGLLGRNGTRRDVFIANGATVSTLGAAIGRSCARGRLS